MHIHNPSYIKVLSNQTKINGLLTEAAYAEQRKNSYAVIYTVRRGVKGTVWFFMIEDISDM
jgi:hypothetical protein